MASAPVCSYLFFVWVASYLPTYLPTFTHPLCLSFHFFVGLWVLQSFKWIRRAVTKSIHLSSIVRLPFSSLYLFISSLHSCSFYHTVWLCLVVKSYFCLSSIFLRPFSFYHTVTCRGVFFCLFFCRHSLVCLFLQLIYFHSVPLSHTHCLCLVVKSLFDLFFCSQSFTFIYSPHLFSFCSSITHSVLLWFFFGLFFCSQSFTFIYSPHLLHICLSVSMLKSLRYAQSIT